ncbi:MAG: hypothetical protein GXX01_04805 [Clostridiales bacterium]|jgi:LCP family protein required for cell wall assembly|nr:hypothetical protein [Clostridiales bacterium]
MKKRIILITAGMIFLSAVGYAAHFWHQINRPKDLFEIPVNQNNEELPAGSGESEIEPYQFKEDKLNILLLGLDANEQRYKSMGAFRTDTIILAVIDFTENKVDLLSIPRDSYVKIPGRKERGRVNAAFVYGGGFEGEGFATTIQTVSDLLGGIPIHYYAAIDMNVFIEIIDSLGGIYYNVDVPVANAGLEPGFQKLNGKQALAYARHRKTAGGDIDRVDRQQRLIIDILNQLKSANALTKLPDIFNSIKDEIWTNLNIRQVASLALFAARLDMSNVNRHMLPGTYLDMDNISYWGIDQEKKNQLINELFGLNITSYDKEDDVYYIKAQLKRRLEELKSLANRQANEANKILSDYEQVLLEDERLKIENGLRVLNKAVNEGNLEDIELFANEIKKQLSDLSPKLKKRNDTLTYAERVLAAVEVEMAEYEGRLNANNEKKLRQLMDIINQKISIKSFSDIYTAASDLDSYWSRLKKELDSKPVPTPEPSPSLPPKPTEKPKETQTPIPSDESAPSQEIEEPESTEMVISAEN